MKNRDGFDIDVLLLLADAEFHSGEAMASALKNSRAAVWKRVRRLEANGFRIEKCRGRGYRLVQGIELLDERAIRGGLIGSARREIARLTIRPVVDSTNDFCLQGLDDGTSGHGSVVLAEQQTAGRGRRGRSWLSPFGCNIYMSIVWRFDAVLAQLEGLSLATGIAVIRALRKLGLDIAKLKWPNDVVADGAKLAGILIEMRGDIEGPITVVVGVGLNVRMPGSANDAIDQPWTDICSVAGRNVSRNLLVAELLNECVDVLSEYVPDGFSKFANEWASVDALCGARVSVQSGDQILKGVAEGVDASGALLVRSQGATHVVRGGEVTLRARN